MADMHDIRALDGTSDGIRDGSDAALLRRLFDLTWGGRGDRGELERIESQVYAKLIEAYDAPEPPALAGYGRVAA